MKRFLEWIGFKEKIHVKEHLPPLFKEGEVWWCHMGENVGIEMNGKNEEFIRPVLIFKKYDKYSFFGLPLSTKLKTGSWYVHVGFKKLDQTVIISQGRTYDYRRIKMKMGELEKDQIKIVKTEYFDLHK